MPAEGLQKADAVHAGHHHVEEDQVHGRLGRQQPLPAVARVADGITGGGEQPPYEVAHISVIFHDEDHGHWDDHPGPTVRPEVRSRNSRAGTV